MKHKLIEVAVLTFIAFLICLVFNSNIWIGFGLGSLTYHLIKLLQNED